MLDIYLITNVLYNINCKRFKKHILCVFWQNYCKKWGDITIINLPADGTLPTDIVCSHNRNRFHDTPFHHHSHHIELYLFISGNVTFFTKNEAFPLKRGYLIAIPDGVWHRAVTRDDVPYERIFLNIDIDLIKQLSTPKTDLYRCFDVSDPKEINILNLGSDAFDDYVNFCDELIPTLDKDTYGNDIHQRILLAEILLLANKVHKIKKQPRNIIPPFLEKVTHFIDENLADDLSLAAFSKHFYLNSTYLDRYFKRYMGLSLHQYVTEKRIEQAKQLLRAGKNVTEVCAKSGFGNYSNFIRSFNKRVGISPRKYRTKYQSK